MTKNGKILLISGTVLVGGYALYKLNQAVDQGVQDNIGNATDGVGSALGKVAYFAGILGVSIVAIALAPVGL